MKHVTHYNYAYVDPTSPAKIETQDICFLFMPLYVGKGKLDRCLHGKIAIEEGKQLLTNRLLYVDLKRLQKRGFEPEILKFNDDSTNDDVLQVEGRVILKLGRKGIEADGILCNRALGGEIPDTTGLPSAIRGKKMIEHLHPDHYAKYIAAMSKPKSDDAIKKMVNTRKTNGTYKSGSSHQRARMFILVSPSETVFEVNGNLKKFCEEHNLSWQSLFNNQNAGKIKVDRSRYKNVSRLSTRFWNTVGWECRTS
jgi:hypothetical protein